MRPPLSSLSPHPLAHYLRGQLGHCALLVELDSERARRDGMVRLYVPRARLAFVALFLRKHSPLRFGQLLDLTAVDYPGAAARFRLLYHLLSPAKNRRLLLKSSVVEHKALPSLSPLFSSAAWLEREVWDLFGIFFYRHPDLRRILTDYGFEGFPLRKDFPLSGYLELRYDDEKRRIVEEPLELSQEFRLFHFASPWEKR